MTRAPLDQKSIDAWMARAEAGDEEAQRMLIWVAEQWLTETMMPTPALPGERGAQELQPLQKLQEAAAGTADAAGPQRTGRAT